MKTIVSHFVSACYHITAANSTNRPHAELDVKNGTCPIQ
jgi:hypothetical protein